MSGFDMNDTKRTFVFAHEMGHTLGLFHHQGALMHGGGSWPNPIYQGPSSVDYGTLPPCTGSFAGYGVRCVFNITN